MAEQVDVEIALRQVRQFVSDSEKAQRATEGIGTSTEKAATKSKRAWGGMARTVGNAAIFAGAGLAIKGAVAGASNLAESVNAVNVTFGAAAKQVHAFSEVAVDQAGLSMEHFNQAVVPVGAMLQNMGWSAQGAAKDSIELTKRAADMASVFNTSVPEAMTAIQAALRGEADPIERYGIGLSDAAVKAEAMSMGLAKTEKALTAQDKAQARVALLMKQSNRYAGDFVNTSGGLANQQRILRERYANVSAQLGVTLIPLLLKLTGVLNVLLKNTTAVKVAVVVLGIAFIAYKAIVIATTIANSALTLSMLPWLLIPLAIIAIAVAFVVLYKKVEWFRKGVDATFSFIKKHWRLILVLLTGGTGLAVVMIVKHFGTIKRVFKAIADFIVRQIDRIRGPLSKIAGPLGKVAGVAGRLAGGAERFLGGRALGGGIAVAGRYLVGERGPEMLSLPSGASVAPLPSGATLSAAGAFGTAQIEVPVILDRREIARAVGSYTADKVARR